MKLVKIIGLAIILSIIVYYVPSFFIGFSASTVSPERKTLAAIVIDTQTKEETLRVFVDNSTQNTVAESTLEKSLVEGGALRNTTQMFIYNIVISMIAAIIVFTIVRRIYR